MDNRVVIIHSTAEGDIGRRAMAELEGDGSIMHLGKLFEWQKEERHPIFSILYRDDKLTSRYIKKGHLVYRIEGGFIYPPRL